MNQRKDPHVGFFEHAVVAEVRVQSAELLKELDKVKDKLDLIAEWLEHIAALLRMQAQSREPSPNLRLRGIVGSGVVEGP